MTTLGIGPEARRRLGARRTAEIVADELRRQIIDGELADGDLLPRQEVLVEQFRVSLVSLREALRILETEGLVSVRRGNRGGAVVHAPAKASAAYMLGLLLQSDTVPLADLGTALQELEPMCAALAARRADRGDELIPKLKEINDSMAEHIEDGAKFTEIGGQFHDEVVRGCGNHTMIAVVGSLETLVDRSPELVGRGNHGAGRVPVDEPAPHRNDHSQQDFRRHRSRGRRACPQAFSPPHRRHPDLLQCGRSRAADRRTVAAGAGPTHALDGCESLSVRNALVTGGSGGIGKACGRKLVELGYDVVLTARREELLRAAAAEMGARYAVADAAQPETFAPAVEALDEIDLVVHAAGILGGTYARKQTFAQWRATISANLDSCFVVTSAALPRMKAGSRFVFISSSAAHEPMLARTAYGVEGRDERVRGGTCVGGP